jgi:hypothetical protein
MLADAWRNGPWVPLRRYACHGNLPAPSAFHRHNCLPWNPIAFFLRLKTPPDHSALPPKPVSPALTQLAARSDANVFELKPSFGAEATMCMC